MWPVLFSVFGTQVQSYGVSKALAAVLSGIILGRSFERMGLRKATAHWLVLWATVWGFVGAKVYFVIDNRSSTGWSAPSAFGFVWYGGLIGGTLAVAIFSRRHGLRLGSVAGAIAMPLSLAYGIGQIGCFLAGDDTYGRPTDLPWAMAFPNGAAPVNVPVHPAQLYEAAGAFLIAAILWALQRRVDAITVFGTYLGLSGLARLLVEFIRVNQAVFLGLTEAQWLSIASILIGLLMIVVARDRARRTEAAIRATVALGFVGQHPWGP
jgi:phosphatidylglycerol:prolipoprotein diacylglycerol transferase